MHMGKILLKDIELKGVKTDILIDGNIIAEVAEAGTLKSDASGAEIVDCVGKAVAPGFVNMHTHAGMSLMRGIGEDIAFHEWLDRIWQGESKIDEGCVCGDDQDGNHYIQ